MPTLPQSLPIVFVSRTFDTGLAAPQRTLIRNALANRFMTLLKANGGYVRKVGILPRPLRNESEEELGILGVALNDLTPAIVIALGKKSMIPTGTDGLEWVGELELVLYAASGHSRDIVGGRLEADVVAQADLTADPGIDVMLEDIEQLVLGQVLAVPTTLELREASEDEIWTGADYSIWEQRYTVRVTRDINPNRAITARVTSIDVKNTAVALGGDVADPLNPVVETVTELEASP